VFVTTSVAAVAANTEGTRFGHLAVESEQTSLKLKTLAHLRAGTGETLQPQALAWEL
jgi:hypothetical protein